MAHSNAIVARGDRVVVKVQIAGPASQVLRQYARERKDRGPCIARLLHEHAVREETRAAMRREMVGTGSDL